MVFDQLELFLNELSARMLIPNLPRRLDHQHRQARPYAHRGILKKQKNVICNMRMSGILKEEDYMFVRVDDGAKTCVRFFGEGS